jgi:anti-sigma regulatory factor (Ser/Thr protein kinase)
MNVTQRFERKTSEVARARRFVRTFLDRWGLGAQTTTVELVVSELVSNAVRHGAGVIEVAMRSNDGQIYLEVTDEGRASDLPWPVKAPPVGKEPGSMGLWLVDQMTDRWGAASDAEHTRVWAITQAAEDAEEPELDHSLG